MKKIIISVTTVCCLVGMSGCTSEMDDSTRTKTEGVGTGVLAGALIGGLIGGKRGAMLGAALGGLAGYAYGSHVADQKAKYARMEDWLDASIAQAQKVNKSIHAYNSRLAKEIAKTKQYAKLYQQKKISKSQYAAQQRVLKREQANAKKKLAIIEEELKAQRKVMSDPDSRKSPTERKKLAREIQKMENEKSTLKRHSRTVANLSVMSAV